MDEVLIPHIKLLWIYIHVAVITYTFCMYCVSVINALLDSVRENKEELKLNEDDILSLAKKYGVFWPDLELRCTTKLYWLTDVTQM